jgi:hypothetical protein
MRHYVSWEGTAKFIPNRFRALGFRSLGATRTRCTQKRRENDAVGCDFGWKDTSFEVATQYLPRGGPTGQVSHNLLAS